MDWRKRMRPVYDAARPGSRRILSQDPGIFKVQHLKPSLLYCVLCRIRRKHFTRGCAPSSSIQGIRSRRDQHSYCDSQRCCLSQVSADQLPCALLAAKAAQTLNRRGLTGHSRRPRCRRREGAACRRSSCLPVCPVSCQHSLTRTRPEWTASQQRALLSPARHGIRSWWCGRACAAVE
jgi:hypothetical protein